MNDKLLKELTEAHGVPSREDAIREIVRRELKGLCDFRTDTMGNLICLKRGNQRDSEGLEGTKASKSAPTRTNPNQSEPTRTSPKKLMLAAHMDEIGFLVKFVDDNGFLRLQPLGGWDPRQMASQRVFVHAKEGPLNGVLMAGVKPKHLLSPEEMNKPVQIENYFVDAGLDPEDAKKRVQIGDMVTMNRTYQRMGKLATCKCMDDRVAVYVMIEAMKAAKKHAVDVYGVATVQEEIGLRGATTSGWSIEPDICIAIDITLANDFPGIPVEDQITRLGEGAAIKILDSSLICHPKVVDHFRRLAVKHKIKHQMEVLPMGGTDAGGVQRLHGGVPSFTLSIPTRYVHTVNETVHEDDVDACVALLARYIEDADRGEYGYE